MLILQISFIQSFPNLTDLVVHISENDYENLSLLCDCDNIRSLTIKSKDSKPFLFDLSVISSLFHLTSLSIYDFIFEDLKPLSWLQELESLSVKGSKLFDLLPLQRLANLSYLDLRKTLLSREHRRIVRGRSEVKKVIDSFNPVLFLDLSIIDDRDANVDLRDYQKFSNLKSLCLRNPRLSNVQDTYYEQFEHLESLDLSVTFATVDSLSFHDISFLSCLHHLKHLSLNGWSFSDFSIVSWFIKLESLSVNNTDVKTLTPLSNMNNLERLCCRHTLVSDLSPLLSLRNLSFLDVRETRLKIRHQKLVAGISEVRKLVEDVQSLCPSFVVGKRKSGESFSR
ncbi:hypothetical protein RCL1_001536 [Eukaryota sp. TZLM3-RCL]